MRRPGLFVALALPLALVAAAACSAPSAGRYAPQALPDPGSFGPVAGLLDVRCGSLDCHGTVGRNLRLYGSAGLRWSPADGPFVPLCDTAEEVSQDYESVVGLEPEIMSAVVAGADPSELTLVRKARGAEAHKGGTIWATGDDSDVCLTSWLTGKPEPAACKRGAASVLPAQAGELRPSARVLHLAMTMQDYRPAARTRAA